MIFLYRVCGAKMKNFNRFTFKSIGGHYMTYNMFSAFSKAVYKNGNIPLGCRTLHQDGYNIYFSKNTDYVTFYSKNNSIIDSYIRR